MKHYTQLKHPWINYFPTSKNLTLSTGSTLASPIPFFLGSPLHTPVGTPSSTPLPNTNFMTLEALRVLGSQMPVVNGSDPSIMKDNLAVLQYLNDSASRSPLARATPTLNGSLLAASTGLPNSAEMQVMSNMFGLSIPTVQSTQVQPSGETSSILHVGSM
uniref:Uncharacterized protein n=1 Tax=Panagrolaimus sp. JU765 TaxID=591449 RepID=A0AC34R8L7_9BILA